MKVEGSDITFNLGDLIKVNEIIMKIHFLWKNKCPVLESKVPIDLIWPLISHILQFDLIWAMVTRLTWEFVNKMILGKKFFLRALFDFHLMPMCQTTYLLYYFFLQTRSMVYLNVSKEHVFWFNSRHLMWLIEALRQWHNRWVERSKRERHWARAREGGEEGRKW